MRLRSSVLLSALVLLRCTKDVPEAPEQRAKQAQPREVKKLAVPMKEERAPDLVVRDARSAEAPPVTEKKAALKAKDLTVVVNGASGLGARGVGVGTGGVGAGRGAASLGDLGTAGGGVAYGRGTGRMESALGARINNALGSVSAGEARSIERYQHTGVNAWTLTEKDAQSTFAADVDTASYSLARAKLRAGELPPRDSVRVEEWLNAFRYHYAQPPAEGALAVYLDAAPSPFDTTKHLLRVGVQGRRLSQAERKPAHLTFLVDVSGSMQAADRLPLAKRALRLLVDQLSPADTVALVTYAGAVKLVLAPTKATARMQILEAIEGLNAGGSTAMSSGITLAYQQALKTLDGKSTSRVIILSDGDANVGTTGHEAILREIRGHVSEGITVTTVGFGMNNYNSELMEQLADKGNGNHFYVDSLMQARRIFVEELGGTLEVIAQDVKLQVEFDPKQVNAYRLIGYENRDVADQDFRNDKVDAGEIGSGHTVTALYEVELKEGAGAGLATVRVRAKKPRGVSAVEVAFPFQAESLATTFGAASQDFRFATAVMGAAELARGSSHAAEWSLARVLELARTSAGTTAERMEFVELLEKTQRLF